MIIPDTVKILFKKYTVCRDNNMRDDKGNLLYGQIDHIEQLITLNEDAGLEQQKATLMHEMVHGLDDLYSIGLKEKQVEKLGTALYMLVRDNPEMFAEDKL
ncbi:MAG: hypothetical protein IJ198_11895 [Lachnospiraceae bacterium]|nr:hypothetical protein [Lachnospiraceae bacterium]